MTDADFNLLLATTRARLDKLTRPTFEREVVESLLEALDRRGTRMPDPSDDDPDDDDFDWDAPLNPRERDMEEALDDKIAEFDAQSTRANQLEQALAAAQQQAHAFAMQIQWFLDATPDAINARLTYLREMRTRLDGEHPQDSAIHSR